MRRVLIIGGCGYVGSRLSEELFRRGYDITVIDTMWFGNHLSPNIKCIKADAINLTEDDLHGYDTVVWVAGLSNDAQSNFSPLRNFIENAAYPVHIAYLAKRAGVSRFIHAGSCSALGYAPDYNHDELSPVAAQAPYGNAKGMAESGLLTMADEYFSVISFRKATISGWSPRMRLDLLCNTMYRAAVQHQTITVNNPAIWRPVLAISDAVEGYITAIEAPQVINGIFNLVSENATVLTVAERIKMRLEQLGYPDIALNVLNIPDVRNYRATGDKAQQVLGFNPRGSVETIVNELHKKRDLFLDFNNPNYINIDIFKGIV